MSRQTAFIESAHFERCLSGSRWTPMKNVPIAIKLSSGTIILKYFYLLGCPPGERLPFLHAVEFQDIADITISSLNPSARFLP